MPSTTNGNTGGIPAETPTEGARRWYAPAWLDVPGLPSFEVIDTRSAQGRLDPRPKTVTVADLVLFHGHACDGLLRGIWAMRALADVAFPRQPFDRSDLLVVSKNSPCLGDVAVYLTGGRARFGTHRLDDTLGVSFVVRRLSSGDAWEVSEEPGFFPLLIATWEAALLGDELDPAEKAELLVVHEAAQWDWVRNTLLTSAPDEHYQIRHLDHLKLPQHCSKPAAPTPSTERSTHRTRLPAATSLTSTATSLTSPSPETGWSVTSKGRPRVHDPSRRMLPTLPSISG